MQKNTKIMLFVALGAAAAVGAYMYFKPTKDEEKSGFWGIKKPKKMTQPNDTFRNTNVPCNAAPSGDIPKSGTIHINGWGTKVCLPTSTSRLTPGDTCSTAMPGDVPNTYGIVDYAGRCRPKRVNS